MNTVQISTLIVTSPEELKRGGETYVTMGRSISIPVQPYVGMMIIVNPSGLGGEKTDRWGRLLQTLNGSNVGVFRVESIAVVIGDTTRDMPDTVSAMVKMSETFEPTLDRFRAHIHILQQFYGFEQLA